MMKIALIQIDPLIGDFQRQFNAICEGLQAAQKAGCQLAVLPELALGGYPPRGLIEQPEFVAANRRCLERLIATVQGIGVMVGLITTDRDQGGDRLFNSAVLFADGRIVAQVDKQRLPAHADFDERRCFTPGRPGRPVVFQGRRIGVTIGEDLWGDKDPACEACRAVDPARVLAQAGVDLLVNMAASPFEQGKILRRERALAAAAADYGVPLLFVNLVGGNDHLLFDGASAVFDGTGRIVGRAGDFVTDLIVFDTVTGCSAMHPVAENETAAIYGALVMGTRDYVVKCGFDKALIGLSGGVDSALAAVIAAEALGPEKVTGVFMPSAYTQAASHEDAERLAHNLGIDYRVMPIDELYAGFVSALVPAADPGQPTLTEQNIQARIRGLLLMGLSNRDGGIVLSTSNKSELAVGYCTLYGDMNGGLALLADLYKTQVYQLCDWINRRQAVIPQRILDRAPSAELKPGQTDQDDLPPYAELDALLKGYLEESRSPAALIAAGFAAALVHNVVQRIRQSEYKRRQAAPCLQISARPFGAAQRVPIAQNFRPLKTA